ncbi:DinB family protein [Flagellimonas hymeniacidonis]|uniref:DinB family protein n=1 Tax=Flagellimonas hymeniacidonis TaxID=2603628 RepID=A0A5C8V2B3_9FLAO|nr:DinB family protein [Flagellimonas hymeniacidonis]TXN35055.1 DinB family protein [Flagellimonas hymeniacidonis]
MEFNITESIQILTKTPSVISNLLKDLPETWIKTNEGVDTWSPYDVVGHLIHGEKTDWIPRALIILGENEDKAFVPFDRFAQLKNSSSRTLKQLLAEFEELRTENIQKLQALSIDEQTLERKGIHPEFGEVTLKQLLATWVVHDLGHINQITRVMAKNYKIEVGPWTKYLAILRDKK